MDELDIDVLLLSVGADLPYLTGYEAMPLERLTMLVLPRDGRRAARRARGSRRRGSTPQDDVFGIVPWDETDDPVALGRAPRRVSRGAPRSATRPGPASCSRSKRALPSATFVPAASVIGPLRIVKDDAEIEALRRAARAVDVVAAEMRAASLRAVAPSSTCTASSSNGCSRAGTSGPTSRSSPPARHAASPHHEPSADRVIVDGDIVLCDFGGTMQHYCSDITRMFHVGEPTAEVRDAYAVLVDAQEAGVRAATVGTPCEAGRRRRARVIAAAGFGDYFVHRVGHGIGCDAHEDPYMVAGNALPLAPGHAFSVEPGIYLPGRFGMRLEDIVVATADGPVRLNEAARDLVLVA